METGDRLRLVDDQESNAKQVEHIRRTDVTPAFRLATEQVVVAQFKSVIAQHAGNAVLHERRLRIRLHTVQHTIRQLHTLQMRCDRVVGEQLRCPRRERKETAIDAPTVSGDHHHQGERRDVRTQSAHRRRDEQRTPDEYKQQQAHCANLQLRGILLHRSRTLRNRQRLGQSLQHAGAAHQRKQGKATTHEEDRAHRHAPRQHAIATDGGQHRDRERHEIEHHPHRADLVEQRQQLEERLVEWRIAAEREEQEEKCPNAERNCQPPPRGVTERERGEREWQESDVLRVELDRVPSPVVIEDAVELRKNRRKDLGRRQCVARRKGPPRVAAPFGSGRILDVLNERHDLQRADADPNTDRDRRERQRDPRVAAGGALAVPKSEIERPQSERDEQEVRHVIVAEHDQGDDDGKRTERPALLATDRVQQCPKCEWRERRYEKFAVVSWTHLRRHDACELVCDTGHDRRAPTHPQRTGEAKSEPAREHEMNRHAPRDREIDGHDPPQPRRRVENVAVHRGDVRQTAEQERIPLRNRSGRRERVGAEEAK